MMIESCSKECCTNNKMINKMMIESCSKEVVTIKDKQSEDTEL